MKNKKADGERISKNSKPKWVRMVLRRRFLVITLLLLQIWLIVMMFLSVGTNYSVFAPTMSLLSYIVVIYILGIEDKPSYKLTWVVLILAVPFFGGLFYLMLRFQGGRKTFRKKIETIEKETNSLFIRNAESEEKLKNFDINNYMLSKYLFGHKGFPVYENTGVEYYDTGEKKFESMISELKKAEKFIFLEYFIIGKGKMWDSILDILQEKVKKGIEVRVIFDDIGCFALLPKNYHKYLESIGIKCVLFGPFVPILSTQQNNRDHRKIAVIDGKVAFTGGVNIADEYINEKKRFGHWKDAAVMIKGEGVWSFTLMFLQTWNVLRPEDKDYLKYKTDYTEETDGFMQPYCDRPYDDDTVGEHVYMSIINRACNYIYITTPYLILENSMSYALCEAARSGVDVRIITPHIPDKAYVHMTTRSYYPELLKAGVKIYEYTNGFIHSKTFVSDDKIGTVGTINADYRSLYLHFECGLLIHGGSAIKDIKKDFLDTVKISHKIKLKDCKRNIFSRIVQRMLRLFAPLM